MKTFENPSNGYRESVGSASIIWALLFGWIYYAIRGLWVHIAVQVLIVLGLGSITGGAGAIIAIPMWLIYAFLTPAIIESRYQKIGWRQVDPDSPSFDSRVAQNSVPRAVPPISVAAPITPGRPERKCPYCAELVKAEAVICRFCQRDLPPLAVSLSEPTAGAAVVNVDVSTPYRCVALLEARGCVVRRPNEHTWEVLQPSGVTAYARTPEVLQQLTLKVVGEYAGGVG